MKRTRILSVFLSLCMIVMCMAGLSVSASATETKVIGPGVEYAIGDTIKLTEVTYIVNDDESDKANDYDSRESTLAAPTYYSASYNQFFFNVLLDSLCITPPAGGSTNPDDVAGLKVVSGDGTSGSPYKFAIVYKEASTSDTGSDSTEEPAADDHATGESETVKPTISWSMSSVFGIHGIAGQEYTIAEKGSDPDWSSAQKAKSGGDPISFYDLTPATWYTIYTRIAATDTTPAGEAVSIDEITSLEGLGLTAQTLIGSAVTVIPYPKDAEGLTYQWYRATITPVDPDYPDGAFTTDEEKIEGATGVTYTLTETELDKYYIVKIYKDGVELMSSSELGPVEYGTVIFDSKGGSEAADITGLKYNDKVTKPADPTRTGYTFSGWYYEGDEGDELWDFDKDVIEWNETTLFAKWEAESTDTTDSGVTAPSYNPSSVITNTTTSDTSASTSTAAADATADNAKEETVSAVDDATDTEENFGGADISTDPADLEQAVLTDADRQAIKDGESVNVYLEVKEVEPTAEEETLIETAAEDIGDDISIAAYLDLNLFKQVGSSSAVQINETNGQIEISFALPEGLENDDPTVERSYYIARIHDGEVEIIPAAYDSETGKISFLTDKFSTYAIIFVDVALEEGGELSTEEDEVPDLSDSIVYVIVESKNITVRLHGGLVSEENYHVIFFTYEKIEGGESLTRVDTEFPTEPGTYIAAIVANEGSEFFGENRSEPFTIETTEAAEETNPVTGAELPGLAVLTISAAAVLFTAKRKLK